MQALQFWPKVGSSEPHMPMWCEMVMWMQWALFFHQSISPNPIIIRYGFVTQREQDVNMAILSIKGKCTAVFKRWVHSIRNTIRCSSMWPWYFHRFCCHLLICVSLMDKYTAEYTCCFQPYLLFSCFVCSSTISPRSWLCYSRIAFLVVL